MGLNTEIQAQKEIVLRIYLSKKGAYGTLFVDGQAEKVGNGVFEFVEGQFIGLYYNIAGSRQSYILCAGGKRECNLPQTEGYAEIVMSVLGRRAGRVEQLFVKASETHYSLKEVSREKWALLEIMAQTAPAWNAENIINSLRKIDEEDMKSKSRYEPRRRRSK